MLVVAEFTTTSISIFIITQASDSEAVASVKPINPVKYTDPDGRIVIPVPVPWFVPWSIPYMEPFIVPIDILPPIYVNPEDGFYRFVPDSNDSDIDWNYDRMDRI